MPNISYDFRDIPQITALYSIGFNTHLSLSVFVEAATASGHCTPTTFMVVYVIPFPNGVNDFEFCSKLNTK